MIRIIGSLSHMIQILGSLLNSRMLIKNDPNRSSELDLRNRLDPSIESQFAEIVEMTVTICVNGLLDPRSVKNLKVADP